jgi:hypothetical protein
MLVLGEAAVGVGLRRRSGNVGRDWGGTGRERRGGKWGG